MASGTVRLGLQVQELVAQGLILVTYAALATWLRFGQRYRIEDLQRVRAEFLALVGRDRGPLLICANHLTLIDSLVLQWAMASGWRIAPRRRLFPWNLPDKRNLATRWWWQVIGYLCKCIPVVRNATPDETRRTLDKVTWLLRRGQSVVIFPEGGRSRVGKVDVDSATYGVGRILQAVPGTPVLCVFLRGRGQQAYSDYPAKGESFVVRQERITPATTADGMRGARDMARQIVGRLSEMEQRYFADASAGR